MVVRGCAEQSSVSPVATPMRFSPKSKASTVPTSGVPSHVGELRKADAEFLHRGGQALLRRQIEQDAGLGGHRQPRVLSQLIFKLSGIPAGIAQGDENFRWQAGAANRI